MRPTFGVRAHLYLTAWTTTPWTLPANLALCVGPDIDYAVVEDLESGDQVIFAEARLGDYDKSLAKALAAESPDVASGREISLRTSHSRRGPHRPSVRAALPLLRGSAGQLRGARGRLRDDRGRNRASFTSPRPTARMISGSVARRESISLTHSIVRHAFRAPVTDYEGLFCKDADKLIIQDG